MGSDERVNYQQPYNKVPIVEEAWKNNGKSLMDVYRVKKDNHDLYHQLKEEKSKSKLGKNLLSQQHEILKQMIEVTDMKNNLKNNLNNNYNNLDEKVKKEIRYRITSDEHYEKIREI